MKKLPNPIDFGKKIAKALKFAFGPSSRVSHDDIAKAVAYHIYNDSIPFPNTLSLDDKINNLTVGILLELFLDRKDLFSYSSHDTVENIRKMARENLNEYDEKDEYPKIGDLEVINVDKLIGGINS